MSRSAKQVCIAMVAIQMVLAPQYLSACPVCVMAEDSFGLSHPHAIRIALATRKAIDGGLIEESKKRPREEFEANLIRASSLVAYPLTMGARTAIDVLIVDEAMVYRVDLNGRGSRITQHPAESQPVSELLIVTSRSAIHALGDAMMPVAEAIKHGLLELESSQAMTTKQRRIGQPKVMSGP